MKQHKLIKGVGVGAALTGAALGLTGCNFHPKNMEVTDVYGPPFVQDEPETDAAAQRDFRPEDMPIEAVYGPPPEEAPETEAASRANRETTGSANDPQTEAKQETEAAAQEPFDPTNMQIEPAYGPPPEDYRFPSEETP